MTRCQKTQKKEARYIVFASFFLCRTMLFSVVRDFRITQQLLSSVAPSLE